MKINLKELKKKHKKLSELDIETLTSLIEAAQSGDKKSENYLFKIVGEHYHRTLQVSNIEDAEDIIQIALMSLYTTYRHFKIIPKKIQRIS